MAVERPPMDTAGPAAPVAGLGGARTGVVGFGPARAAAGLVDPRAGRDGDLPGPAGLPAAHEVSPPWPGCQAPTNPPSRRARPGRSRIAHPPYSPPVGPAGHGLGAAASSATVPCPQIRSASGRPYGCALTRQVWPVDQAISPSPRASRDVAGGRTAGRQPRSRAGHAPSCVPPWWCRARTPRSSPWLGAAGRTSSLGRAGRSQ